jgi:hypothetical protein
VFRYKGIFNTQLVLDMWWWLILSAICIFIPPSMQVTIPVPLAPTTIKHANSFLAYDTRIRKTWLPPLTSLLKFHCVMEIRNEIIFYGNFLARVDSNKAILTSDIVHSSLWRDLLPPSSWLNQEDGDNIFQIISNWEFLMFWKIVLLWDLLI